MADIYHKAARDGYVDLLREATRKDCNAPDEDGMTPVLWAAFYGNLDALRLLVGRGGNPDRSDFFGNTALHCSAGNGHMPCVSFLVSFGSNMWALDNDFHTPLDIASLKNHHDIVKYLDQSLAQQSLLNKKMAAKLKEKAVIDAEKRVKRYNKLQQKAQKRLEREEKKLERGREKVMIPTLSESAPASTNGTVRSRYATIGQNSTMSSFSEPKPFSAHFNNSQKKSRLGGVAKRIKQKRTIPDNEFKIGEVEVDGKRTVRSLAGLQRDPHIMYMKNGDSTTNGEDGLKRDDTISRALSEPNFNYNADSGVDLSMESPQPEPGGIFERPGFGSVAFMNRRLTSGALLSLPSDSNTDDSGQSSSTGNSSHEKVTRKNSLTDSIGTLGSLVGRLKDLPWDDDEIETLDDEEINQSTPLELFLAVHGCSEYLAVLTREKIDMDALMLVSDNDLKEIGMPLGPRRKILDATARRKQTLNNPGVVMDSLL